MRGGTVGLLDREVENVVQRAPNTAGKYSVNAMNYEECASLYPSKDRAMDPNQKDRDSYKRNRVKNSIVQNRKNRVRYLKSRNKTLD